VSGVVSNVALGGDEIVCACHHVGRFEREQQLPARDLFFEVPGLAASLVIRPD